MQEQTNPPGDTGTQSPSYLPIGITERGVMHVDVDEFDVDTRFAMVKASGVYDYFDKTPEHEAQVDEYLAASERHGLPVRAGGWFYRLGRDENLLREKLALSARLGSVVHNTQILTRHADGHDVTDAEVAEIYLRATEWGEQVGCLPTFEVHINMWSEDFRRINAVADLVAARGVPFRMTLDHSHVIFKIDNPEEQEVQNMRPAVEDGSLVLDPFAANSICQQWIERGLVWHCHARAAVPNNPKNTAYPYRDGRPGRGVQYPFFQPADGEYVAPWHEEQLEPWKEVVRQLLRYHARTNSPLGQISTEFIPGPDYGAGHGYSIFEHSVACARWLRTTWDEIQAEGAAVSPHADATGDLRNVAG